MLKVLRNKKTARKIWIGLAIIIIPAFTLWGFGSASRSREENAPVGKLFGRTISALEFKEAIDAVRIQAVMQFGEKYSQMQQYLNFENEAINRLILLREAKIRKIRVSDKEVIEQIESYPYFRYRGQFDQKNYNQTLQYGLHIQPRAFEEQVRQNIMLAKLYKQYSDGVNLTDDQIREEYRRQNKKISVYYLAAVPAEFSKEILPSENELLEYYKKDPAQFKEWLSLNMEYVALDDLQKAKDAAGLIKKNAGLEKIAQKYAVVIKETGFFSQNDPIPGLGWSPVMSEMVSKLKIGQYAEPLTMDNKYYFMRLKDRKEPNIPEFEKIKAKVKDSFIKEKSEGLAKDRIESAFKLSKETPGKGDFNLIGKKSGLKAGTTDLFQLNSYIEGIGASNKLWLEADKLKPDEPSGVISMPSGYYIIRVKQSIEPGAKQFAAEKDGFSLKVISRKKQEAFSKFVENLRAKAQ
ncbi:MAG: peptidylprolyl isomerase [Candidatus Omnitrophota bacterium]|jgi:hypothetical protein